MISAARHRKRGERLSGPANFLGSSSLKASHTSLAKKGENEKDWFPGRPPEVLNKGGEGPEGGELAPDKASNNKPEAIKCLLKQFNISVLSNTGTESTLIWGGSSASPELAERDFTMFQNLLGSFRFSVN